MAVYSFDYDFRYNPSAPVVQVEIGSSHSPKTIILSALLDTGADATMLPKRILKQLHAPLVDTRVLRTVTGLRTIVNLYRVSFRIGPYHLPNLRVVAMDSPDEAILGRDLLNQLVITLNGLAPVTEISQ